MPDALTIQGRGADRVIEVADDAQLSQAVGDCAAAGQPIVDYGRYHADLGHPPPAGFARLVQPAGIVEHHVADMTVSVNCATSLAELNQALARRHQWLPIDGAPADITLGEIISHNVYGPLRCGFGSVRDLLLGVQWFDCHGQLMTVGSRTVKNVAGYDVWRFMVGSLNTLGVLARCTLRTWAIPGQVLQITAESIDPHALIDNTTGLLTSDASPAWCYWSGLLTDLTSGQLHLGYLGSAGECEGRARALGPWLETIGAKAAATERNKTDLNEDSAHRADAWAAVFGASAAVKLVVPPEYCGRALARLAEKIDAPITVHLLPTAGTIWLTGPLNADQAGQLDQAIAGWLAERPGWRAWVQRPQGAADLQPVAPRPTDWSTIERLSEAIDPSNLFNPGRVFGTGSA
jgi:glycolate oxidase FAD binding subunit